MIIKTKVSNVVSEKVTVRVNICTEDDSIQFVFPRAGKLGIIRALSAASLLNAAAAALRKAAIETQNELYGN